MSRTNQLSYQVYDVFIRPLFTENNHHWMFARNDDRDRIRGIDVPYGANHSVTIVDSGGAICYLIAISSMCGVIIPFPPPWGWLFDRALVCAVLFDRMVRWIPLKTELDQIERRPSLINILWLKAGLLNQSPTTTILDPTSSYVAIGATIGAGQRQMKTKAIVVRREQIIQKIIDDGVEVPKFPGASEAQPIPKEVGRCAEQAPFLSILSGINPDGHPENESRVYGLCLSTNVLDQPDIKALRPFDTIEKIQEVHRVSLLAPACGNCRAMVLSWKLPYLELLRDSENVPCFASILTPGEGNVYESAPWNLPLWLPGQGVRYS